MSNTFTSRALVRPLAAFVYSFVLIHPFAWSSALDDYDSSQSAMRPLIQRFSHDRDDLLRYYDSKLSATRRDRLKAFYQDWQQRLTKIGFNDLTQDGKIDYILLRNYLGRELGQIDFEWEQDSRSTVYIPFADAVISLDETRRNGQPVNPQASAAVLTKLKRDISAVQERDTKKPAGPDANTLFQRRVDGNRAADNVDLLRHTLHAWYTFYADYDPLFTWWNQEAYRGADSALNGYARFLRQNVAGIKQPADRSTPEVQPGTKPEGSDPQALGAAKPGDTSDIIGVPIGREHLRSELSYELIPYTPEELIALANDEFAWCEQQMRLASRDMGLGDDWRTALEKVKNLYVQPGKQPQLIRDLEHEAEAFVNQHDLVTIPPLASETWHMEMMTPQRQLINPFFTGGDTITVSYPTAEMNYDQKLMSMRGNNIPFARATVFHELIPGHELQLYMSARFHAYRGELGATPFALEGWPLYWELLFWDMKFQKTPEDRIGALFWRMHRCARIIFSLNFHLGKMTPDQCVDFLVNRVGHERENAIAEVRRSVSGQYGPLYQAAYLLGGLQLYALHADLVDSGTMTNRQFHDAILRENIIPIELIRAKLTKQKLTPDYQPAWKFIRPQSTR